MNPALQEALVGATTNTLESMCFSMPEGYTDLGAPLLALAVAVRFEGDFSGTMHLTASSSAASDLTASFLGTDPDEVSNDGGYPVLLELANIICGATLSSYHKDGHFKLFAPESLTNAEPPTEWDASCAVQLESGPVAAVLTLERQP